MKTLTLSMLLLTGGLAAQAGGVYYRHHAHFRPSVSLYFGAYPYAGSSNATYYWTPRPAPPPGPAGATGSTKAGK